MTPVSQLTGDALEWAVASILWPGDTYVRDPRDMVCPYSFTKQWGNAGPLIDLEHISITFAGESTSVEEPWSANVSLHQAVYTGKTALEAAMRTFVASKLGEAIELPASLVP